MEKIRIEESGFLVPCNSMLTPSQDGGNFTSDFLRIFTINRVNQITPNFHQESVLDVSSCRKNLVSPHSLLLLHWHLPFLLCIRFVLQILKQCNFWEKVHKSCKSADYNHLSVKSLLNLGNPTLLIGL